MRRIANRGYLMSFPGRSISSGVPSAEAAVLRSPDSSNSAVADIAALINALPLSPFQKRIMILIGGVVVMDGFDVQAIGFVAPALTQDWHIDPAALGPNFWSRAPWYAVWFDAVEHCRRSCWPTARAGR